MFEARLLVVDVDALVVENVEQVQANARCSTLRASNHFLNTKRSQVNGFALENLLLHIVLVLEEAVELLALVDLDLLREAVTETGNGVDTVVILFW